MFFFSSMLILDTLGNLEYPTCINTAHTQSPIPNFRSLNKIKKVSFQPAVFDRFPPFMSAQECFA